MHFEAAELLARDASVRELLRPLLPFLDAPGVTEVCVNRPGEVFVEAGAAWSHHAAPELTLARCYSLATAIATFTEQQIGAQNPILSAVLPQGERIQIVLPPVAEHEEVSLSIRRPSRTLKPLADYEADGALASYTWARSPRLTEHLDALDPIDRTLLEHLERRRLAAFLSLAVREKKNIAVVGATGSGKTTLMKTLCQDIPADERLLTIEDVRELALPRHANRVHLLYAKARQGVAEVTPSDLIASAMRMKPDRVLLAELRGPEAFDFLKLLTTGHSGSITSFHAESCALALERYVLMAQEHPQAAAYAPAALKHLVSLTLDVIVHITARNTYDNDGQPLRKERFVSQVSFDPLRKFEAQFGPVTGPRP